MSAEQYDREQERDLIRRVKRGEARATRELLEKHHALMLRYAKKYSSVRGYELDDAMQQARIGCVDAAKRFDFLRKVKFATYAAWRIRYHCKRYMQNTVGDIRTPVWRQDRPSHRPIRAARLDAPLRRREGGDGDETIADLIAVDTMPPDEQIHADRIAAAAKRMVPRLLKGLDERQMTIVRENLCQSEDEATSLAALGRKLGVSRERMRQVRDELVVKLRRKATRMGGRKLLEAA